MVPALAGALLNKVGLPAPVGAMILSFLFPKEEEVPGYFQLVLEQIKDIVHSEFVANDLHEVSAQVQNIIGYISGDYANCKKNPQSYTKVDYYNDIKSRSDVISEAVHRLMQSDLAQPGLSLFLTAASVEMAVWQEMALVDPKVSDPIDSAHLLTVTEKANSAVRFLSEQWAILQQSRLNSIKLKSSTDDEGGSDNPAGTGGVHVPQKRRSCYWWYDELTTEEGFHHCGSGEAADEQATAQAEWLVHRERALATLSANLGNPDQVVVQWQRVALKPLASPLLQYVYAIEQISDATVGDGAVWTIQLIWATKGTWSVVLEFRDGQTVAPIEIGASGDRTFSGPRDRDGEKPSFLFLQDNLGLDETVEIPIIRACTLVAIASPAIPSGFANFMFLDRNLFPVADRSQFEKYFLSWNSVTVPSLIKFVGVASPWSDMRLIGSRDGHSFLHVNGGKRWIREGWMGVLGFNPERIEILSDAELAQIPDMRPIP
jgi:hypothetical protein